MRGPRPRDRQTAGAAPVRRCPSCAARAARAEVEAALAAAGWPWRRRLSLWLDALLILEEGA